MGVLIMSLFNCQADDKPVIRKPAVAGQFYSGNPDELKTEVEKYLAHGKKLKEYPQLLISPHAGHVYSGALAGLGFAAISPAIERVILIGPTHRVPFNGIAVSGADYFETPLGKIPLDKKLIAKLLKSNLVSVNDKAHEPEHCLEVQLPFLQVALKSFTLVPLLMHAVDEQEAAELLNPFIDDKTILVSSSDFAHVYDYNECKGLDKQSIETILSGNINGPIQACGEVPIRVMMRIAKMRNLKPVLLDARNSQDITGQIGGGYVVGYASIVYLSETNDPSGEKEKSEPSSDLSKGDKEYMLALAREALEKAVRGEKPPSPDKVPGSAKPVCGCFVTLTKGGNLRGCIGYIEGIKPLYQAIIDNAKNAALGDPRFPNVTADELKSIKVEVSVLTKPEPFSYNGTDDLLRKIEPGVDGIILKKGYRQSTFLPQVWDQLPDKKEFLEHLAMKAGLDRNEWKNAEYKKYRAIHFEEE